MNTLEKVKRWFIDRDLENGGRLDKQSLKLSEEFGELCAVVIVGLSLLIKKDVHKIFKDSERIKIKDVTECLKWLNSNISDFQLTHNLVEKRVCRDNLVSSIGYLKSISNALGYDFEECFELAYQEIKDRKGRWIDGTFVKEEDLG